MADNTKSTDPRLKEAWDAARHANDLAKQGISDALSDVRAASGAVVQDMPFIVQWQKANLKEQSRRALAARLAVLGLKSGFLVSRLRYLLAAFVWSVTLLVATLVLLLLFFGVASVAFWILIKAVRLL